MTNYIITGASRGIGFELVSQLLAKESTKLVVAAVRSKSSQLESLESNPKLKVLDGVDVSDESSIKKAAEQLKSTRFNVLINNAGILQTRGGIKETSVDELLETFRVNTIGPLVTTRNFVSLLEGTSDHPAVIATISSVMGSVATTNDGSAAAYRISKSAVNMVNKLSALEYGAKNVVSIAIHPGWVQTDMGGSNAAVTPKDSVQGILNVISNATLADNGGYKTYQGADIAF